MNQCLFSAELFYISLIQNVTLKEMLEGIKYMCQLIIRLYPVKFNMYYDKRIVWSVLLFILLVVSTQTIVILPTAMYQTGTNECVQYEQKQKLIHIFCKSIHFTDIYRQINNNSILHTESDSDVNQSTSSGKGKSMVSLLIDRYNQ